MKHGMKRVAGKEDTSLVRLGSLIVGIIIICLSSSSPGYCSGIFGERDGEPVPAARYTMIYVEDFELEAGNMESDEGLLQRQREQRPLLGNVTPRPLGTRKDPSVRARELVDLMSSSLVKELVDLGLDARRLGPGERNPSQGLLVRGVFARVDEGNRLKRAVVGFGAGETELQVLVSVSDLAQGSPVPLYELNAGAESGKMPGAVITMNPYAAAAKFVLSDRDLDKSVRKTAGKIAADIAARAGK